MFTDSHSHIYLPHFDEDRDEMLKRTIDNGVKHIFLPNIDQESIDPMLELCRSYPGICYPMMGLHPTSVKKDFEKQLEIVDSWLGKKRFSAIGECGIDLYWDKTYFEEQKIAFRYQIDLAKKYDLPIVIHARESFKEIYDIIDNEWDESLKGVFHSFTGDLDDVKKIKSYGFKFGINGIVTFKNSDLKNVVKHVELKDILLETDSPYLAPVPKRGKRNESSFIVYIAATLSEIYGISIDELSRITTMNTLNLFNTDI